MAPYPMRLTVIEVPGSVKSPPRSLKFVICFSSSLFINQREGTHSIIKPSRDRQGAGFPCYRTHCAKPLVFSAPGNYQGNVVVLFMRTELPNLINNRLEQVL